MTPRESRIVSFEELRFRPANSNERTRAGLDHAFKDVPPCSFARDDGISSYAGAISGIGDFPDGHHDRPALHPDIPQVGHDAPGLSEVVVHRMGRGGFALSVFLHGAAALAIGYLASVSLPDQALLAGETIVSLELVSDSVVEARSAGEDEKVDVPEPTAVEREIVDEAPTEVVEKPVEKSAEDIVTPEPVEKTAEPVAATDEPEILATDQPSRFAVEQAARTILEANDIEPLPAALPKDLVAPVAEEKPVAAKPLPHPVSKPRKIEKVAEAKAKIEPRPADPRPEPADTQEERAKDDSEKPAPKLVENKPEKKKPVEKSRKFKGNGGADESDSLRGANNPKNKGDRSQEASQGGRKNSQIGNAAASSYKGLVQRKLERAKKRVRAAGKGSVTVSFTITANGGVTGLRIRKSSGKPAVDDAALDVVRKASPFPAIPAEAKRTSWSMSVPMTFK